MKYKGYIMKYIENSSSPIYIQKSWEYLCQNVRVRASSIADGGHKRKLAITYVKWIQII